ncbi:FHA domain containing protein [Haliangium ochraceum DSM 14365]|uniref:FHA domain containing protein n=1 Tax=Haliangium ochraceum (strain DSM 14365 / JCM 11303 / SMP-2) TaxID=502025 RepID=D0LG81_HALO1|nr:FHA domain containing protein [Haliangium ochraceum DSM 14365]
MAGARVPITFRIYKGDTFVREETLTQPVIKVGKLSSSHLRLDDDAVSRMHAVIEVSGPGDVSIIDLGSTKGTHVNGQKINKAKLQSGDQISVGNTRLEIAIAGASDEEEDAPTRVHDVNGMNARAAAAPASSPAAAPPTPARPAPAGRPAAAPARPAPARPAPAPAAAPARPAPAPMAAPAAAPAPMAQSTAAAAAAPPAFGANASAGDASGARAIEIAAMLGDSVVGVKHLLNPKSGKITPMTYGLFIGGGILLLLGFIAFFFGVEVAAFNKVAHHEWVHDLKRPEFEFFQLHEKKLNPVFDWMAFGGMLFGTVAMSFGLVRLRNEKQSPYFRIGSAPEVEFPFDPAPVAAFPLVGPRGDEFVFNFAAGMDGEMMVEGETIPLAELQGKGRAQPAADLAGTVQVPIPAKARIRVNAGKSTFLISSVPRPKRLAAPLFAALESRVLMFFAASALFHFGLIAVLLNLPPDPRSLSLALGNNENRLTRFQSKAQEDPKQEEEEEEASDVASGGTGTAMALDEGKMGKEDSTRATGQFAMKNEDAADPQLAREQAMEQARNAGVLGSIKAMQGGAFASLTGTGDFASGLDDANVYGGLLGDEVGEMQGGFGFGRSGFGPGGGGDGWGTVGTGQYGTIGHGSGTGSGYGAGSGRGGMRNRRASPPEVRIGNAVATGDLDKNIIRRYIRRKLPQITYCYEKQLLVRSDLSGTVVTQFQISPQGVVLNSKADGVSKEVSSCVATVMQSITFPKPKGGGLVQVRYPFTFRPSGG